MELIDRYLYALGAVIAPKKKEPTISKVKDRIRELIDSRIGKGEELTEEVATAALSELGPPAKVAEENGGSPFLLISPYMWQPFLTVVLIFSTLYVFRLITTIVGGVRDGGVVFLNEMYEFVESAGWTFLWVLVVFVIIDRSRIKRNRNRAFRASALPSLPRTTYKVKETKTLFILLFSSLILIVLVLFPEKLAIYSYGPDGWKTYSILSEGFSIYIPAIGLLLIGVLLHSAFLLRMTHWSPFMRWADIGLRIAQILLLYWMVYGPVPIEIPEAYLSESNQELKENIDEITNVFVDVILYITILAEGFVLFARLRRFWKARTFRPYQEFN